MTVNKTKIEHCEFEYECPKIWGALLKTNIPSIRYCDSCERNVFLSESIKEARENAAKGRCIAIPVELADASKRKVEKTHMVGMAGPPPYKVNS